MNILHNFHFLSPLWLLALIPLAGLLWLIFNHNVADNTWHKVIDANLLPFLLNQGNTAQQGKLALWLLALAWFIGVIALANPVWEKKPRPVFQTNSARVIVFDLSRSMHIADLKPSRLARARFKIEDILRKQEEGQIGLVVFAGDAFTAVPLTRDGDTIRAVLPSLNPNIMPIQGSRADLGLRKAEELLQQAGIKNGDILLISDGVQGDLAQQAAQQIATQGHRISVMAVGTEQGGAIPNVTDQQRNKIVVKVDLKSLQAVAEQGGGVYSPIQNNDSDLRQLLSPMQTGKQNNMQDSDNIDNTDWKEQGPLLVLLLLPLAALAFRRGWLLSISISSVLLISTTPRPALALQWDDLWLRADQQADKAFQQGEFAAASETAQDPMLRGNAEYKQGNYQQAIDAFSTANSADALYNKGNALAKLGRYQEAIDTYNEVLKQQPDFADAKTNKQHVETLLKQQQDKQKNPQQQNNNKDKQQQSKDGEQQKQDDKENKADNKDGNKDSQNGQQQDQGEANQQEQQNASSDAKQQQNKDANSDTNNKQGKENNQGQEKQQQNNAFEQAAKEQAEKEQQLTQEEQQAKQQEQQGATDPATAAASAAQEQQAKQLSREEKIAADQWLRRIPDEPGSLLQRKFKYQYQQRSAPEGTAGSQPW